tara:strand:- start:4977 stop:6149 length:1173 start_codon:yes stop_codon:yes gene_type:complete
MKKIIILIGVLFTQALSGQSYVQQVLILNEGYFDYNTNQIVEPVTVGSYDPVTQIYSTVDTITGARFASDIIIDGDYFFVAADNTLYKYDLDTYSIINSQTIPGIRNIVIHKNNIVVTRGEYLTDYDSYLQVYSKIDLSLITQFDTITGPKWPTQNMIVTDSIVYVAINNGYEWGNEKGLIGILDIKNITYINEIDLGPDGKNPDNMVFDGMNIYTVNNKDWSGASISQIDINTNSTLTFNIGNINIGCGTSCLRDNKINYQMSGDNQLFEWDPLFTTTIGTTPGLNNNYYELAVDNSNNLYATSTDWVSYGTVHIYDSNNMLINSFSCGVSPGSIAFDNRSTPVSINELHYIDIVDHNIYNLSGKQVNYSTISIPGIYIVNGIKTYISK